tara:strand:- start:926 stop:1201 length:276 start_codon:yes stop_codon:yes gene_type:complete
MLSKKAFGIASGIVCAVCTFLIGFLGMIADNFSGKLQSGLTTVLETTNPFYIFDLSTVLGLFLGTVEAFIFWFVLGWCFVLLYNYFAKLFK